MKIFQKVRCKAYLQKISDGIYIRRENPDGTPYGYKYANVHTKAYVYDKDNNEIADLSEFDGMCVEKTYRKRMEEDFNGMLVGFTRVAVKGKIGTDWCEPYGSQEYGFCFREITEMPKVGVVYFKNNCKRYVLPEDMESMNDSNSI